MPDKAWTCAIALLGATALTLGAACAVADDASGMPSHQHHAGPKITMSTVHYVVPDVTLVRDDGKSVSLPEEINDGRPVMLNFIFTSCGSVCPLMSQMFSQFEHKLGDESDQVHLLSISIDPEADTPSRLSAYAQKYGAGPEWRFYTGTLAASIAAQQAFDVYRGDKMSHPPVTLLRAAPGEPWRRIDGFVTPDELMQEYRQVLAAR